MDRIKDLLNSKETREPTGQTPNGPNHPLNQTSPVHQSESTSSTQSPSNPEPTPLLTKATEEPLSTPRPKETINQKEPTKVSTNSLLPRKTRDGKRNSSEKLSSQRTIPSHNGTQLETKLMPMLLLPNGERQMLMPCQLLPELSLIKPLKQVNLHHGINHLPTTLKKIQKRMMQKFEKLFRRNLLIKVYSELLFMVRKKR